MRSALTNFQGDVAHINKVVDWLISPAALAPSMLPAARAISCGCIVLMSGYFESFLKELMCNFITAVNDLGKPFHDLPDNIRYAHFDKGAKALQKELKKDKEIGNTINSESMAKRLASVSAGTGYQLVWEAFADTQANPGPAVVSELIKTIGVTDVWRKLENVALAKKGNLETFLSSFIAIRNECAHTGSITSPPTATDLIEYGENLIAISEAIVCLLENRLQEIKTH